jgi:hypothetical protein
MESLKWREIFFLNQKYSIPGNLANLHSSMIDSYFLLFNLKTQFKSIYASQALVAHACNPSYSGGGGQEDHRSKPAHANSSGRTYLKKTFYKKGLVQWLMV